MNPFKFSHRKGLTVTPINLDNIAKAMTINPHNAAIYVTSLRADMVRFGFSLPAWMLAVLSC
jgi:hypothetical protein